MPIDVICGGCDKKYRLKDELAGKRFKCKGCDKVLVAKASAKRVSSPRRPESSTAAPAPTPTRSPKRRPKRRTAPIEDPFADDYDKFEAESGGGLGGDLAEDYGDYGDDLGDDYAAPPPKRRKKKKSAAKSRGFKKSKQKSSVIDGLPPMTFNLNRLNAGLVIAGCFLIFTGIKEWRVSSGASSTAKEVSLETLYAEGPGDDVYLTVSGVQPVTEFYVATEGRFGRMTEIWYACAPASEQNRPKFILYSTAAHTETDVAMLMSRGTHTGMLISSVSGLDSEAKGLFRENVPGVNVDSPMVFQVGRKPSGFLLWVGMILGGLVLVLGGLFWVFFLHS